MAENNINSLREEIREPVKRFVQKLTGELGENLKSVTVTGSSLTDDYKPGKSDINTVLVLKELNQQTLISLAQMGRTMRKGKLAVPLLMTDAYIERSRDVFGIEFLDFQLIHQTVQGEDPFENLGFEKSDVRAQCERELKATLIRLRQGYIAAGGHMKLVRDILISAQLSLIPLLRAMLWLKEIERSPQRDPVLKRSAEEFSVDVDPLFAANRWQHKETKANRAIVATTFQSFYDTVDRLAVIVDEMEV